MRNYGIPLFFSIMALHGGGHLELKKMHKGDFWGIFGIRLGRCPCIIPEKISFLQFYSRFNPNALALYTQITPETFRLMPILHHGYLFLSLLFFHHGCSFFFSIFYHGYLNVRLFPFNIHDAVSHPIMLHLVDTWT